MNEPKKQTMPIFDTFGASCFCFGFSKNKKMYNF